jgi:glycerophosphoryl diester phosphodiesterase
VLAVAHRAGNSLDAVTEALAAGVDLAEADVHVFRRALEVRHWKTAGPHLFWDGWELVRRRDVVLPALSEVLAALGERVMLDLKGVRRELAPAVAALLREAAPGSPVTICTRHWWMLDAFAADSCLRLVPSAGSRLGLRRLRARVRRRPAYGVSVRRDLLTPEVVAELHAGAEHVFTWPVDTAAELADARRLGVSGVTSKNLSLLREVIDSRR